MNAQEVYFITIEYKIGSVQKMALSENQIYDLILQTGIDNMIYLTIINENGIIPVGKEINFKITKGNDTEKKIGRLLSYEELKDENIKFYKILIGQYIYCIPEIYIKIL